MKRILLCYGLFHLILLFPLISPAQIIIEKNLSSFVLTNEGDDRMIDSLVSAGCTNLYQALLYIRNHMAAEAPVLLTDKMDALIDTLNSLSGIGEVFTAPLQDFAGGNNPVGINADGSFIRSDFSIYTYDGHTGYARYTGKQLITYSTSTEYDIYLGSSEFTQSGILYIFNYLGFAVAWNDNTSGLHEMPSSDAEFLVYPNPCHGGVFIRTPWSLSGVELTDVTGKCLLESDYLSNTYLTLPDLPDGVYFLRIGSEGKSVCRRIIKRSRP